LVSLVRVGRYTVDPNNRREGGQAFVYLTLIRVTARV
jgi:hypothetical protein